MDRVMQEAFHLAAVGPLDLVVLRVF